MGKLKITSIRLDTDTADRIADLTLKHPYWNRSIIINQLLAVILQCSGEDTLFEILSTRNAYEKGYAIHFMQNVDELRKRAQLNMTEKF